MALDVGLALPLAGVASLSGYFHALPQVSSLKQGPQVLVTHGRQDLVVPIQAAWQVRDDLQGRDATVTYLELDGGHEIQMSQIAALRTFSLACISASCPK
jgi:phospholipase/carboxylesterase